MHWLFTNDHLVHEICSYVPKSELPILARVSSTWFKCAVSHLYNSVSIWDALAPLGKTIQKDNTTKFAKSPSDEDVRRFLKYTVHVRNLHMYSDLASFALDVIRNRAFKDIPFLFPNVLFLKWSMSPGYSPECMEVALGLVSPNINRLLLHIYDDRMLHYLSPLLTSRLSGLRSLVIGDSTASKGIIKPVEDILTFFSDTLTLVHLSLSLSIPSVVECLSKMANLRALSIGYCDPEEVKSNSICGDKERFPSLRWFAFEGSPQSFHDMFLYPDGLPSLTELYFYAEFTPNEVQIVLLAIVMACPCISILCLGVEDYDQDSDDWPVVPWSYIQPISSCKDLGSLSFNNMHVSVELDELTEFLKTRTTWTRLEITTSSPLRLKDILLYAEHCPDLVHLRVYVDTPDEFSGCVKNLPSDSKLPQFSSLDTLDFSRSKISPNITSQAFNLTQFLYRICENPPNKLEGLDEELIDNIWRNLAILYVNECCRSGMPMSNKVGEFLRMVLKPQS